MLRHAVWGAICLLISSAPAFAQESSNRSSDRAAAPSAPVTATPPNSGESMEDPLPGDHWTYELRDEITGEVKSTFTQVVMEASASTISVRANVLGNSTPSYLTFDRGWNFLNAGAWKYTPNDGSGVRLPLSVDQTWSVQSNNVMHGITFKRSGTAKVVGRESIATQAGTFDAFKVQVSYSDRSVIFPAKKYDAVVETWYVPAVDHWVKRTFTSRVDGQLRENHTVELIEFGRKGQRHELKKQ